LTPAALPAVRNAGRRRGMVPQSHQGMIRSSNTQDQPRSARDKTRRPSNSVLKKRQFRVPLLAQAHDDGSSMPKFSATMLALVFLTAIRAEADDPMSFGVVSKADLTSALNTATKWNLVITHEPDDSGIDGVVGSLHFCFVHNGKAACPDVCMPSGVVLNNSRTCHSQNGTAYNAFEGLSSFQTVGKAKANLIVATVAWTGGASAFWYGPVIWAYHRQSDSFERIFSAVENLSNNGEVRFIPAGPLAGDVVLNQLTYSWPYRYDIVVYGLLSPGRYVKVLDYNGNTTEGDGNSLSVIDAEMPEIERRLGYWKTGDLLPTIPQAAIPSQCKTPIRLQKGLAWCDWSR